MSAKSDVRDISELSNDALAELGVVLAKTEALLISFFKPYRVITAKLGFSAGFSCHFHMLPVSTALLDEIRAHPIYTDEPDGNDALLFASREYGERSLTQKEQSFQQDTVKQLKAFLAAGFV